MHDTEARYLADRIQELGGIMDVKLRLGGKHWIISWTSPTNGKDREKSVATSPSDWRARRNAVADIRRILMEDGDLRRITDEDRQRDEDRRRKVALERTAAALKRDLEEQRLIQARIERRRAALAGVGQLA